MAFEGVSQLNIGSIYRGLRDVRFGSLYTLGKSYVYANSLFNKKLEGDIEQPHAMHIELTTGCGGGCEDCYVPIGDRRVMNIIDRKILKKAIAKGKSWGIYLFNFIGGETIREDTIPLIIETVGGNPDKAFVCCSNGKYYAENGKYFDDLTCLNNFSMALSLDGLRETNDKIRGKGAFEKTMLTAEKLKSKRCLTGAVPTIRKSNWEELCSDEFIDMVVGRNFSYIAYSYADKEDVDTISKFSESLQKMRRKPIYMYSSLGQIGDNSKKTKPRDVYVDVNGNFMVNRKDREVIGNLDSSASEILGNEKWVSRFC